MVANEFQADSVLYGNAGAIPGSLYKLTPYVLTLQNRFFYQIDLLLMRFNTSVVNVLVISFICWNICHPFFYSFSWICDRPQQKIRRLQLLASLIFQIKVTDSPNCLQGSFRFSYLLILSSRHQSLFILLHIKETN